MIGLNCENPSRKYLTEQGSFFLLLVAVANGSAQESFTSYLQAQRLPQDTTTSLKIYGYPGSTNQIQYADTLTSSTRWNVLTNIALVNLVTQGEYLAVVGTNPSYFIGDTTNKPAGTFYFVIGRYYTSHPVGEKLPNPWGLYDMHGDLSEWCQDFFGFYSGGAVLDPQGPATGDERVLRSGSWLDDPYSLRCAFRYSAPAVNVSGIYGFRVVLAPTWP